MGLVGYCCPQALAQGSPLTNAAVPTPCDGSNWFGWPCDQTLENIRLEYLNADTDVVKRLDEIRQNMKLESTTQISLKKAPYRTGSQFVPLEATQNQRTLTRQQQMRHLEQAIPQLERQVL